MNKSGIVLIDKPTGITSHDVVDHVRRITGERRVGHAGTLDPLATGLLIVLVGRSATRLSDVLRGHDKTYTIGALIGYSTDSLDADGTITEKWPLEDPRVATTRKDIESIIAKFPKTYEQEVPAFSAVKVEGRKLYEQARRGESISILPKRTVHIHNLVLEEFHEKSSSYPQFTLTAHVSSGTYTRSLLRDIGILLGKPVTQVSLRRLQIGQFDVKDAVLMDDMKIDDVIPLERLGLAPKAGQELQSNPAIE